MVELVCTARRVGDYESRTEEYELSYTADGSTPHELRIKYQAARAYEINAALDDAVDTARKAISEADPALADKPIDGSLSQFAWRAIQSVKYEEGKAITTSLQL